MPTSSDFIAVPQAASVVTPSRSDVGGQSTPRLGFQPYRPSSEETKSRPSMTVTSSFTTSVAPGSTDSNPGVRTLTRPFDVATIAPFALSGYR